MGIVQYPNGHFYNNDVFDQCPNCNADSMTFGNSDAPTVPVSYGASGMDFSSDVSSDFLSDVPSSLPTDAMFSEMAAEKKGADDSGQTIAFYNKEEYKIGPVAGWLVCISGPDKGKDYRILAGRNLIGRSSTNKYQVNLSDMNISRTEAVASIAYDDRHNEFIFGAGSYGNLLPFVDGEPCMNQLPISAYSRIEIGETTMLFVPFCGAQFTWKSDSEKDKNGSQSG